MLKTTEDRYNGVTIDSSTLPVKSNEFIEEILLLINSLENKPLLWIKIPIEKSEFIPILTDLEFEFHHCDERSLMLVKKLNRDSFVPATKNYIVGVGAIVLHDGKLLVVKDRFSIGYKLPGGHIDKNETLKAAVKREIKEETGVDIEFESIINLGHFRNGQFGESNIYIVCTAKALTTEISINDADEILEAKWIDPSKFLESEDVYNYNKSVVQAALNNKELKLTEQQIELRASSGEVFF